MPQSYEVPQWRPVFLSSALRDISWARWYEVRFQLCIWKELLFHLCHRLSVRDFLNVRNESIRPGCCCHLLLLLSLAPLIFCQCMMVGAELRVLVPPPTQHLVLSFISFSFLCSVPVFILSKLSSDPFYLLVVPPIGSSCPLFLVNGREGSIPWRLSGYWVQKILVDSNNEEKTHWVIARFFRFTRLLMLCSNCGLTAAMAVAGQL